jgi:hypothetical protein
MAQRNLTCPQCHTVSSLNTDWDRLDINKALVTCPKCGFKATVALFLSGGIAGGGYGPGGATVIPPSKQADKRKGYLRIGSGSGKEFALKEGENMIGRSETADIVISSDEYVSRRHVIIEGVAKAQGCEYRLKEINCKNPVVLNGNVVGRGDVIVLETGDKLTLGRTEVYFELK